MVPDLRNSGAVSCLPKWAEVKNFLLLGAPTAVALTGQVATCMALTFAASGCDTIALAAHQVKNRKSYTYTVAGKKRVGSAVWDITKYAS